jgi:hypothetical protein
MAGPRDIDGRLRFRRALKSPANMKLRLLAFLACDIVMDCINYMLTAP